MRLMQRAARSGRSAITLAVPGDGRSFAALRLGLGISQGALAKELGWHASTLAHREASIAPLSDDKRAFWLSALRRATARRMGDLRKLGLGLADMPADGLGTLLAVYSADAGGEMLGGDAA